MEEVNSNSIETRSSSRSNRSSSPFVVKEELEEPNNISEYRITRSQSVESNGSDSRKRRKKNNSAKPNTENSSQQDIERETRTSIQKSTKEAREAKKAKRELIIKERLNELEKLEKTVKDGSNREYHKLLENIEEKRAKMANVAEMRRSFAEGTVTNFYNAQKYAAYSQYHWDKLALRRSMIQYVQHKINLLEQEYYSNHVQSSLDEDHLTEWVPPDRPSMISSLTLGLSEEDAENDIECIKSDLSTENDSPLAKSPPLNMLASLVDHQQKDEKHFTLPPLNPWRYDQNPSSLPT